jgi:hypothetical protein
MQNIFIFKQIKFGLLSFVLANFCFSANQFASALPNAIVPGSGKSADKSTSDKDKATPADAAKEKETEAEISNAVSVTTEQLVTKPQEYLNKDIKFTAKFACFNSLALDYKPAFRSSRNYLSFLVFKADTKTPYSELKLAMPIPKEKDPETHMLQTLKEGDLLEVYGKVFACPLDEPWLDVIKIKKLASSADKNKLAGDKDASGDKDSEEDSSSENKHE